MKTLRSFLICSASCLLLASAGCHHRDATAPNAAVQSQWTRAELFFGQSMPEGKSLSPAEWQHFVDEQLTPVFSEGLTIVEASGQYKSRAGAIAKEPSKLVIVVYKSAAEKESAIRKLIDEYKRQFRQESVLWTSEKVDAKF
jgi:hypothetical protein